MLIRFLLLAAVLGASSACRLDSYANPDHVIIASNMPNQCRMVFEVVPAQGVCPVGFFMNDTHLTDSVRECVSRPLRMHLVPSGSGSPGSPPRLFFIGRGGATSAVTFQLKSLMANSSVGMDSFVANARRPHDVHIASSLHYKTLGSVYDSRYHYLYLFWSRDYFAVYWINVDEESTGSGYGRGLQNWQMFNAKLHPQAVNRRDWSEDPYQDKVYYTVFDLAKHSTFVYQLDMSELQNALIKGYPGTLVHTFEDERSLLSVSQGLLITSSRSAGTMTVYSTVVGENAASEESCECDASATSFPLDSMSDWHPIIVRDNDYCMVRYLEDSDKALCKEKLLPSEAHSSDDMFHVWLLAVLLAIAVLVVVCLCIGLCRFRYLYEDAIEKQANYPVPYYAVPNGVSHMEDMDVTVDRWN